MLDCIPDGQPELSAVLDIVLQHLGAVTYGDHDVRDTVPTQPGQLVGDDRQAGHLRHGLRPVLGELRQAHEAAGAVATIALARYRSSWGVVELDGDRVTGFEQSPVLPYWINGGVYYAEPALTEMLPKISDHEDSTFPQLAREGRLGGFRIDGYWRGVDTVKDIMEANAEFAVSS